MRSRLLLPVLMSALLFSAATPANARQRTFRSVKPHGFFGSVSLNMFQMDGSGTMETPWDSNTLFNVKRRFAYGLVSSSFQSSETMLGLDWDSDQVSGASLGFGYRFSSRLDIRWSFFWALDKSFDEYGIEPEIDENSLHESPLGYLQKQHTLSSYKSSRLLLDFVPFEPLPSWFFTVGTEYAMLDAHLGFRFGERSPEELEFSRTVSQEADERSNMWGFVIGSGLQFTGEGDRANEWYISATYSYVPYKHKYFSWESDLNFGGITVEAGLRMYLLTYKK